jgi:pilus assembly protein CpaE
MSVCCIMGAKGGCGASLVATNLGVLLAQKGGCLLVDLHPYWGYDDLLLDLEADRAWMELLPVAAELNALHLALATARHPSGLLLLGVGEGVAAAVAPQGLETLIAALRGHFPWLLLDLSPYWLPAVETSMSAQDAFLLVSTPDPLALRAARRILARMAEESRKRTVLVLNQLDRRHPLQAQAVADSLGATLLGVLPPDPRAVGAQVNFGQPCVADARSSFGRGIAALAQRLAQAAQAPAHEPCPVAEGEPQTEQGPQRGRP